MRVLAAQLALVLAAVAVPANAFLPRAERVAQAAAEVNAAAARAQTLRLEVQMRIGEGDPIAVGSLVTHPSGLARLELRAANQLVERHLLRGSEHLASRNGRLVGHPRALLPPLFLLQTDSALTLRAALRAYGVRVDAVAMAPCGQADCYVLGDTEHAPPPIIPDIPVPDAGLDSDTDFGIEAVPPGVEPEVLLDAQAGSERPLGELQWISPDASEPPPLPEGAPIRRAWVDSEGFEILRLDLLDGVQIRFGPIASFGAVRFPSWIGIQEPDRRPIRIEIVRVAPVSAALAAAFGTEWLLEQIDERADPALPAPPPDTTAPPLPVPLPRRPAASP